MKWWLVLEQSSDEKNFTINQVLHLLEVKLSHPSFTNFYIFIVVILDDPIDSKFMKSSSKEIQRLLDYANFASVNENDVPPAPIMLKSRMVYAIK